MRQVEQYILKVFSSAWPALVPIFYPVDEGTIAGTLLDNAVPEAERRIL